MARRDHSGVRLYTRNGYDFAGRFPQIVEAVSKLKVRSCFIDVRPKRTGATSDGATGGTRRIAANIAKLPEQLRTLIVQLAASRRPIRIQASD